MTVAHVGPPTGRLGGSAGYLAQLQRALDLHGTGRHTVLMPPPGPPTTAALGRPGAALSWLRRIRLTYLKPPRFVRPSDAELLRVGGHVDRMLTASWEHMAADSAPALDRGLGGNAEVLFAHDPASAERALERRCVGQQVWLFLHSPMPHALYLAWCFGVPERRWEDVRMFPDVHAWIAREMRVVGAVDAVWLPCREAVGEWVRVHARCETVLARASFLLTGAAGPARTHAVERAALRSRWGLPERTPVVLFLGTAQAYRGLDLLLSALEHLPSVGETPGLLALAGMRPDTLALHPRVRALGRVSDVADLLAAVDFVVNVNRFSLFDLSIIEALEAGLPVLLTPVGGNQTFRDLGAGCCMVDALTPAAIAAGLMRCFGMSEEERGELGARSRRCYDGHLTLRHLRDRHMAAYDALGAETPMAG